MFQLIGVVSALTPEECIKENKELRKFTEFRERKKNKSDRLGKCSFRLK